MPSVSVMLTRWRRPQNLEMQFRAIERQTMPADSIWLFDNSHQPLERTWLESFSQVITARPNLGVWPRFTACLEMASEFVCILDDDTIPGKRWLENCLTNFRQQPGLYGTIGVIFTSGDRRPFKRVGWSEPNAKRRQVDLAGHAWFLKRDWLQAFAGTARPVRADGSHYRTCGEDYFLSYALQKIGVATYVPPHPKNEKQLWGSIMGKKLGQDAKALYRDKAQEPLKKEFHRQLRSPEFDWKTLSDVHQLCP